MTSRLRWVAIGVFMLANTLSFLDRNLLSAVAPGLRAEFGMSNEDYGNIVGAFSLAYALSAPVAGWFLDKAGLNLGISIGLALWSAVGIVTGFTAASARWAQRRGNSASRLDPSGPRCWPA
jgi:ACS family hexuronate transporter-like MFS transporter